jgi:hypothetical protein
MGVCELGVCVCVKNAADEEGPGAVQNAAPLAAV